MLIKSIAAVGGLSVKSDSLEAKSDNGQPPWYKLDYSAVSIAFALTVVLAMIGLASVTIGVGTYLSIQLPILLMAGTVGVWLFYVQHQYEGVYWARHQDWDPMKAALEGSSYYRLPKVLQWFTGNIGLHHIHHARPGIPNYNLQQCHDGIPVLRAVEPMTFRKSLKSLRMNLCDEREQKLVSFRSVKTPPTR